MPLSDFASKYLEDKPEEEKQKTPSQRLIDFESKYLAGREGAQPREEPKPREEEAPEPREEGGPKPIFTSKKGVEFYIPEDLEREEWKRTGKRKMDISRAVVEGGKRVVRDTAGMVKAFSDILQQPSDPTFEGIAEHVPFIPKDETSKAIGKAISKPADFIVNMKALQPDRLFQETKPGGVRGVLEDVAGTLPQVAEVVPISGFVKRALTRSRHSRQRLSMRRFRLQWKGLPWIAS
jgi:hypothetical protein